MVTNFQEKEKEKENTTPFHYLLLLLPPPIQFPLQFTLLSSLSTIRFPPINQKQNKMPLSQTTFLQFLSFTLTTLLFIPFAHSHYHYSSSSAPSIYTDWRSARATYYAASDPRDAVGGACGFGDLEKNGYGKSTVGLSTVLFEKGQICGACFQVRCVEDLRWCIPGTSIIVTATNFCAPNYGFEPDGGGHCNPPNAHFVLPIEAFEKIAIWKASNMPIQYRRY